MALVHEPVAHVDDEGHEEQQHGEPEGKHHDDRAALAGPQLGDASAHVHPAEYAEGTASRRITVLEVMVFVRIVVLFPTNGRK